MARLIPALLLVVVTGGCGLAGGLLPGAMASDERLARTVTIVRDEWGVPHVYAPTDAGAAFGVAYAQAEDAYAALEERYIHALGRASYWYGERYLAADLVRALFEVERLAREEYAREPAERRQLWDAYAAGLNYYRRTAGVQPRVITVWEPWMPFALLRDVSAGTVIDSIVLGTTGAWEHAGTTVQLVGTWHANTDESRGGDGGADESAADATTWRQPHGAAAWAVAGSRTADGHALLFESGSTGYEVLVHSEAGWHVRGRTAHGTPVPRSGHNGRVAWAHTPSGAAGAQLVELEFDDVADPLHYRHDGAAHRATLWQDTILVNTTAGVVPHVATFLRTPHGPVVAAAGGRALAARIAGHAEGGALQQWLALGRAQDVAGVAAALAGVASVGVTTVAADASGAIVLVTDGVVATAAAGGVVQSAGGEAAADPGAGARAFVPAGAVARARAAQQLLARDEPWTFDAWAAAAFDTFLPTAAAQIPGVVLEWEEIGGRNPERAMRLDTALDTLRGWNGYGATDSRATSLFILWQERLRSGTYDGAYPRFRALEDAVLELERDHAGVVAWGELNRIVRTLPDAAAALQPAGMPATDTAGVPASDTAGAPSAGAPAWTGMVHRVDSRPAAGGRRDVFGDVFVTVTELAPRVRARSVGLFGQSADAAAAHFADQAALYAAGALRDAPFERDDVMQRARRVYQPGPARTVR